MKPSSPPPPRRELRASHAALADEHRGININAAKEDEQISRRLPAVRNWV